jgi:hypothetical protein
MRHMHHTHMRYFSRVRWKRLLSTHQYQLLQPDRHITIHHLQRLHPPILLDTIVRYLQLILQRVIVSDVGCAVCYYRCHTPRGVVPLCQFGNFFPPNLTLSLSRRAYQGPNKFNALFKVGSKKKREPYLKISGTLLLDRRRFRDLGVSESFLFQGHLISFMGSVYNPISLQLINFLVCQKESRASVG